MVSAMKLVAHVISAHVTYNGPCTKQLMLQVKRHVVNECS